MSGDNVNPRELYVFRAKLAEISEQYDDMVSFIREAIKHVSGEAHGPGSPSGGPSLEEVELLQTAFHRAVSERRSALRVLQSIDAKTPNSQSALNQDYYKHVVSEMLALCSDALHLSQSLLKNTTDPDLKVLLYKMLGDHHRYKCEVNVGESALKAALEAYAQAATEAEALTIAHPLKLQVALAQVVLYMEHAKDNAKAKDLAERTISTAKYVVVNAQRDPAYRDAALTLQLMEDRMSELMSIA